MDVKIQYKLATRAQAERLFLQFFPTALDEIEELARPMNRNANGASLSEKAGTTTPTMAVLVNSTETASDTTTIAEEAQEENTTFIISSKTSGAYAAGMSSSQIAALASQFASILPETEFSMAELQGYLLRKKWDPVGAVEGLKKWLEEREEEVREREERLRKKEEKRKNKRKAAKKREEEEEGSEVGSERKRSGRKGLKGVLEEEKEGKEE